MAAMIYRQRQQQGSDMVTGCEDMLVGACRGQGSGLLVVMVVAAAAWEGLVKGLIARSIHRVQLGGGPLTDLV